MVLSSYKSGFKSVCIKVDDVHNVERLKSTIDQIQKQHAGQGRVYGIGVEYGANLLLNYAAKHQATFNGLVSIGNPLDLSLSEKKIENCNWLWKTLLYRYVLQGRIEGYQKYA